MLSDVIFVFGATKTEEPKEDVSTYEYVQVGINFPAFSISHKFSQDACLPFPDSAWSCLLLAYARVMFVCNGPTGSNCSIIHVDIFRERKGRLLPE